MTEPELRFEFDFSDEKIAIKAVCGAYSLFKSYDNDSLRELKGGLPVTTLFRDDFSDPVAKALGRDPDETWELFKDVGSAALKALR